MRISRLAWLDITRRPMAALLAALGIGLAAAAGGVVIQTVGALTADVERADPAADVILGPKSSALNLFLGAIWLTDYTPDLISEGSALEGLSNEIRPRHAIPIARFASFGGAPVVGVTWAWWDRPEGVPGAPALAEGRRPATPNEAVVGARAAARLGLGVGDRLEAHADFEQDGRPVWSGTFEVVGVLQPLGHAMDRALVVDRAAARTAYTRATDLRLLPEADGDGVTHVLVTLDPARADQREQMFQIFHVRRVEQVVNVRRMQSQIREYLGLGGNVAAALTGLLALMAIGVAGSLLSERFTALRAHLGVLRAQGYRRIDVAALLWIEGAALLLGGLLVSLPLERLGAAAVFRAVGVDDLAVVSWPGAGHLPLWGAMTVGLFLVSLIPLSGLYRWSAHDALRVS